MDNEEKEQIGVVIGMDERIMMAEVLIGGEEIVFQPVNRVYGFGDEITIYEEEIYEPYWDKDY